MTERLANDIATSLSAAINASQTSITVTSATGFPAANFRIRIDNELMLVTAVAGTTWTVTRAVESTTAVSHAILADVSHILTAGGLAQALAEVVAAPSDPIPLSINGNHDVWQRTPGGAAVTSTTTFNRITSFAADRLFCLPAGASVTQQRATGATPDTKTLYSNLITGATSVTTIDYGQRFRQDLVNTRGQQSLVFSCNIWNNTGSAFTPNLRVGTPGAANNFTTVTNRLDQALQSCPNTTWTRVWAVFDPSAYTNIGNGMEVVLRLPSGAMNAGTKFCYLAQWDLRPGSALVSYIPPDSGGEIWRCLEYAEVYGGTGLFEVIAQGWSFSTTAAYMGGKFSRKWKTPTISVSANSDFLLVNSNGSGGQTMTAYSATSVSLFSWDANTVTIGSASFTAGSGTEMVTNNTLSARFYIIAELE